MCDQNPCWNSSTQTPSIIIPTAKRAKKLFRWSQPVSLKIQSESLKIQSVSIKTQSESLHSRDCDILPKTGHWHRRFWWSAEKLRWKWPISDMVRGDNYRFLSDNFLASLPFGDFLCMFISAFFKPTWGLSMAAAYCNSRLSVFCSIFWTKADFVSLFSFSVERRSQGGEDSRLLCTDGVATFVIRQALLLKENF